MSTAEESMDSPAVEESTTTDRSRRERTRSPVFEHTTGVVARIFYGLPMIAFGSFHFMQPQQMAGTVPEWLLAPVFWVYLTGVALMAAGVSIITRYAVRTASMLLALLLLTFVATIHVPGLLGEQATQLAMTNLLKDTALAGGALMAARFGAPSSESRT